jgi:hypothetical protein
MFVTSPRPAVAALVATLLLASAATAGELAGDGRVLQGGDDGTVLEDLTVRGEDLIRIEFERPELLLDVDPRTAAGLDWGDPRDLVERSQVDLVGPIAAASADDRCPFLGRPWLEQLRAGTVAVFRPALEGVDRWRLVIADSRADTVAAFEGKGEPPAEIGWDGRKRDGSPVLAGVTCSYVLEAWDRAGNRRNFVGPGFELPAYRISDEKGTVMMFPAERLAGGSFPPVLAEVASWLNQSPPAQPVDVKVSAVSADRAKALAESLVETLRPSVLGDPARLRASYDVRSDAPPGGTVAVLVGF